MWVEVLSVCQPQYSIFYKYSNKCRNVQHVFCFNVIVILCLMLYMYHVHVIVYANKDDDYYYYYISMTFFYTDMYEIQCYMII